MLKPPVIHSLRPVLNWHFRSQHVSRRNALVASTALAAKRRQQIEVDEFLEALPSRRVGPATRWSAGHR